MKALRIKFKGLRREYRHKDYLLLEPGSSIDLYPEGVIIHNNGNKPVYIGGSLYGEKGRNQNG